MLEQLNRLPQVTKNLLIINVLMFFITYLFGNQGINLVETLGAHYINSPLFEPYQVVSHFFMHGGFFHIFMNMFGLVMFGSLLERMWGPKRFFILYVASAIGAFALYNVMGYYEIMRLKEQILASGVDVNDIDKLLKMGQYNQGLYNSNAYVREYITLSYMPMVGASGAVFGLLAAFAYLFPNTQMYILFIPFPIRAKYLVGGYVLYETIAGLNSGLGGGIAHLAHVGGAIVGFILVKVWNKYNKKDFY